jgi:hypothetical protein
MDISISERDYAAEGHWRGSFYELAIDYSGVPAEQRLPVVNALWTSPLLRGPFAGPYAEHQETLRPVPLPAALVPTGSIDFCGVLRLPGRRSVGCHVSANVAEWMIFAIPTGMLELVYGVTYPIEPHDNPWMQEVDEALVDLAQHAYTTMQFELAAIGEEAAALLPRAAGITAERLDEGGYLISSGLFERAHPGAMWDVLPAGLRWRPWRD